MSVKQITKDLEKKAIEARDKGARKAKNNSQALPKIPGVNRATVRKYMKRQRAAAKIWMKKSAYAAKKTAERITEQAAENECL